MQALRRQIAEQDNCESLDEPPMYRVKTAPAGNQDSTGLGLKALGRQFTDATLVDGATANSPGSTPSMSEEDGSEFSANLPTTPTPRNLSISSSKVRRPSNLSMDHGAKASPANSADYGDDIYDSPKKAQTEKIAPGAAGAKARQPDVLEAVVEARKKISHVKKEEQSSEALHIVPQNQTHKPDRALKARFEQLSSESRIRKPNVKEWLRVATWWLLKVSILKMLLNALLDVL